jgi:hypothetical protein
MTSKSKEQVTTRHQEETITNEDKPYLSCSCGAEIDYPTQAEVDYHFSAEHHEEVEAARVAAGELPVEVRLQGALDELIEKGFLSKTSDGNMILTPKGFMELPLLHIDEGDLQ